MRRAVLLVGLALFAGAPPAFGQPRLEEPTLAAGGPLPRAVRDAIADALAERVVLLGDEIYAPRPARESFSRLQALSERMASAPAVFRYLQRAALRAGELRAAEAAAEREVALAPTLPEAHLDLADLYHERNEAKKELAALDRLIAVLHKLPGGAARTILDQVLRRAEALARKSALADPARYEQALVDLHKDDPSYLSRHLDRLLAAALLDPGAEAPLLSALRSYRARGPALLRDLLRIEAALHEGRGEVEKATAVYERALGADPLPPLCSAQHFDEIFADLGALLKRHGRDRGRLRELMQRARKGGALGGFELALFVHLSEQGDKRDRARTLLAGLAPPKTAAEKLLRARLLLRLSSPAEVIPALYGAYRAALVERPEVSGPPGRQAALVAEALADLGHALLIDARVQTALTPLSALSVFSLRRVAAGPSIVGGVLSLLFNARAGEEGRRAAADLDAGARALGNGARAIEIYQALSQRLSQLPVAAGDEAMAAASASAKEGAAGLLLDLIDLHRNLQEYGEAARLAEIFRRAHPTHPRFFEAGLLGCDALLRKGADFAPCFRSLLVEAGRREEPGAYEQVLSRLVSALAEKRRGAEVVRLYWEEIDRRGDPALYDRFLSYLSSRNLHEEELRVYERARAQLPEGGFTERLARFYLRWRGAAALSQLLSRLVSTLSAEGAARLLASPPMEGGDGDGDEEQAKLRTVADFYLELHRRAAARFPLDMNLSAQLLQRLSERPDQAPAEVRRLLKQLAVGDRDREGAEERLFTTLQKDGATEAALEALAAGKSDAERLIRAQLLIRLSRQEQALPLLAALRRSHPHDLPLVLRHAALLRAAARPDLATAAKDAAALLLSETQAHPASGRLLEEAGDYLAEAGQIDEALRCFARLVALAPKDPAVFVQLASIQWDYFRYDEAADSIQQARRLGGDAVSLGEKLAAVYESRGDLRGAIFEYVAQRVAAKETEQHGALRPRDESRAGDEEGDPAEGDDHRGTSAGRLLLLARRGQARAVDTAFLAAWARAGRDPRGGAVALAYADHLAARKEPAARRRFLLSALARLSDLSLLSRVADGEPDREVRLAVLRRIAALSGLAPEPVFALCQVLSQEAGGVAEAERELVALVARLRADEDREGASEAEERLAALLWQRPERKSEAVALLLTAAQGAPAARGEALLFRALAYEEQLGHLDAAQKQARAALSGHRGELRYAELLAGLLWRHGDKEGALAVYKNEIAAAAQLPAKMRAPRVLALRRRLIERHRQAGQHRDAIELWLQVASERPERPDIEDLYEAARQKGHGERVRGHFERARRDAPKDARWPTVLAWLAALDGQGAEAARRYGEALSIAPERLDLREAHAAALGDSGDLVGAARACHELFLLSDRERRHGQCEVEWLGRAGREKEALLALAQYLDGEEEPARFAEEAERLRRVGLSDEALKLAEKAVTGAAAGAGRQPLSEEGGRLYALLMAKAGRGAEAAKRLEGLFDQVRRRADLTAEEDRGRADSTAAALVQALDRHLPEALGQHGTTADLRAYSAALAKRAALAKSTAQIERLARALARAGLHKEARRLAAAHKGAPALGRFLLRELEEAALYADGAQLLSQAPAGRAQAAVLFRRAGDPAAETLALERLLLLPEDDRGAAAEVGFGSYRPEAARLVDLYLARGPRGQEALLALTGRRGPLLSQVATQLLRRGELPLGLRALATLEPKTFTAARQGLALLALGEGPKAAPLLTQATSSQERGLGPISKLLTEGGRSPLLISRSAELGLTLRAAQALYASGKDGQALSAAPVEDRPADARAHIEEGDVLWQAGRKAAAKAAYGRARALSPPKETTYETALSRLARAAWVLGQKDEALRLFDEPLATAEGGLPGRDRAEAARLSRLADTGVPALLARAAERYSGYLLSRGRALPGDELVAALRRLRRAQRDDGAFLRLALALLAETRGLQSEAPLLSVLCGVTPVDDKDALLPEAEREPLLRRGAALPGQAQAPARAAFRLALAALGLKTRRYAVTLAATEKGEDDGGGLPQALHLARAEALWSLGRGAEARALLWAQLGLQEGAEPQAAGEEGTKTRLAEALALLSRVGQKAEAADLLLLYHAQRGLHRLAPGDAAALIEVLLGKGQKKEAQLVLARLAANPEQLEAAARLATDRGLFAEAAALYERLLRREPARAGARLLLARALLGQGDGAAAARAALSVLQLPLRRQLDRAEQEAAGRLLADAARAGAPGLLGRLPTDDDETVLLCRARLGDGGALAAGLVAQPAPARAHALLAEQALLADRPDEALRAALRAAEEGGLDKALSPLAAESAARAGRHGLAVGLALPGDPLLAAAPTSLLAGTVRSERPALLARLADSAAQAGLVSARLRLLSSAAELWRESGKPDEQLERQLKKERRAESTRRLRLRQPLVTKELRPAAYGAPPPGPLSRVDGDADTDADAEGAAP